ADAGEADQGAKINENFASDGSYNQTDDALYDANGNLITDYHNDLVIDYNHLGLPRLIELYNNYYTGEATLLANIWYTYDATGHLLSKEVLGNFSGLSERTYYRDGIEYVQYTDGNTTGPYILKHIATAEGRAVPYEPLDSNPCATQASTTTNEGRAWVYHYDITDHLGSARLTVSSETVTDTYVATMESERATDEQMLFNNLVPVVDQAMNTTTCVDGANEVTRLRTYDNSGTTQYDVFGPNTILAVQPGDEVETHVMARYIATTNNNNFVADLATLAVSAFSGGGVGEFGNTAAQGIGGYFTGTGLLPSDGDQVPQAFLNYAFFNADFQFVAGKEGEKRISSAAASSAEQLRHEAISITEPGYLLIWLSNESNWDVPVAFDDFTVAHTHGKVVQAQDYYPFGAPHREPLAGFNSKYLYQSKEWQSDLGLNLYDFHARQYDPYLGRFTSMDPLDQFASPYSGMGNNPVGYIDPDGRWVHIAIGAAIGGGINLAMNWNNIQGGSLGERLVHGASFFGVGALAGAAATVVGPAAFAAGGGAAGGLAAVLGAGAAAGGVGGGITNIGNTILLGNRNPIDIIGSGVEGFNVGAITGVAFSAAGYGLGKGFNAIKGVFNRPVPKPVMVDYSKTPKFSDLNTRVDDFVAPQSQFKPLPPSRADIADDLLNTRIRTGDFMGLRQVGKYLESVDDVMNNPNLLKGRTLPEVQGILGRTKGWVNDVMRRSTTNPNGGWV
ncbi:MAG: RHS repeat-associated core domain-containing protein, partial [Bacteroidota bacterium]